MITVRYEPALQVSGRTFVVISRVRVGWLRQNGALAFFGDKRPVAVICREESGERIFGVDGQHIDASALQDLIDRGIG